MSMVFSSVFSFYFSLLYNVYLFNAIFFSFAISWLMLNSFLDILLQHVRTACNRVLLNRHRKGQNPFTLSMTYLFVRCMVSSLFSLPAHSLSLSLFESMLSVQDHHILSHIWYQHLSLSLPLFLPLLSLSLFLSYAKKVSDALTKWNRGCDRVSLLLGL